MNLNPFRLTFDVDVYMKSGNVIHLRHLIQFTVSRDGVEISKITQGSTTAKCKIIHINVDQVEAVVQTGWHVDLRWFPRLV